MQKQKGGGWHFWVDRGGTFTDIVAFDPTGKLHCHKLLSEDPKKYDDAIVFGIDHILANSSHSLKESAISEVRIGTTIATNALLERKGARTALVISEGFRDLLTIGYQNRPELFALNIILPEPLFERSIEVKERVDAHGKVLVSLDPKSLESKLRQAKDDGIEALAVVLMHGYKYPAHEKKIFELASKIGFKHIALSHDVSSLIRIVPRGDSTVVDAYLSPLTKNYLERLVPRLRATNTYLMQSSGGLKRADHVSGKDTILSGPAGGVVGAVLACKKAGFHRLVGFDMGGTSTDVAHFSGEFERTLDTNFAGVRLQLPMMRLHSIAAGGGSILSFEGSRFLVGPESAGANPGPACYRKDGPLTLTDANLILGKNYP